MPSTSGVLCDCSRRSEADQRGGIVLYPCGRASSATSGPIRVRHRPAHFYALVVGRVMRRPDRHRFPGAAVVSMPSSGVLCDGSVRAVHELRLQVSMPSSSGVLCDDAAEADEFAVLMAFLCPRRRACYATSGMWRGWQCQSRFYALVVGRVMRHCKATLDFAMAGGFLCPRRRACYATRRATPSRSAPIGFYALVVGRVMRRLAGNGPSELRIHSRLRALSPRAGISFPPDAGEDAYPASDLHASAARHMAHHQTARTNKHRRALTPTILSRDAMHVVDRALPTITTLPTMAFRPGWHRLWPSRAAEHPALAPGRSRRFHGARTQGAS